VTALAWVLLAAAAGAVGIGVGVGICGWRAGRRSSGALLAVPAAAVAAPPAVPGPFGPSLAELLQRVFQSSSAGLAVLSRSGEVVLSNPRASELGVLTHDRPDPRAWAACQYVLVSGGSTEVDLSPLDRRGRRPAGVHAHVRPLGEGFALVEAEDASEAMRLEVTRRDFVANVSHELKTPVGAVGLLAEAVLDAADDPVEVHRFATKILKESTRLGHMVTELIALSRLTGAERLPELARVSVDDVVGDAMARCRIAAESAGIEITLDQPSGFEVDGDHTLLVTALSNLIDNAVSYSPTDVPVSITRRCAGRWVEISVTDRGIGIAPEHHTRVFERFFRVDPARSRATGGTGLGLAIVKHVLANHGGEVGLWSTPGTGSTFTMRLPVRAVAATGRGQAVPDRVPALPGG